MTVAVVTLAVSLAAALGVTGYLAYRLVSGLKSERASMAAEIIEGKARVVAELAQRQAERDRDAERAARVKAEAERDAANAKLVEAQTALKKLREEKGREAVERIRSAPDAVRALRELERLFEIVPTSATAAAVPAGDDRSEGGPPAV